MFREREHQTEGGLKNKISLLSDERSCQTPLSLEEWSYSLGPEAGSGSKTKAPPFQKGLPGYKKTTLGPWCRAAPFVSFPDLSKGGRGKTGVGETLDSRSLSEGQRGPTPTGERARGEVALVAATLFQSENH